MSDFDKWREKYYDLLRTSGKVPADWKPTPEDNAELQRMVDALGKRQREPDRPDGPREWWCDITNQIGSAEVFESYRSKPANWDEEFDPEINVHVIEYSAYEQMKAERDLAVHANKLNFEKLAAELSRLRSGLEFYARGEHYEEPNFKNEISDWRIVDNGQVAREILEGKP